MAFMALVLIHPFQAMSCRSERLNWWQLRPNPWIPLSLVALFALQWLAITWGSLARLLGTKPLTGADWLVLASGVLWPVAVLEALLINGDMERGTGESAWLGGDVVQAGALIGMTGDDDPRWLGALERARFARLGTKVRTAT